MVLDQFGYAVLGAVVSLILQGCVAGIRLIREFTGREFSGRMYQILPAFASNGERIDKVRIRQRGAKLTGTIRRISPSEEVKRKWCFAGYYYGETVVVVFYTKVLRIDPASFGVMVLRRDHDIRDCGVWRGFYARPKYEGTGPPNGPGVSNNPIVWQRINPSIKNYGNHSTPTSFDGIM